MAALPALITVEQFRQMKGDGRAYELRHGEVVFVTRPRLGTTSYKTAWLSY